MIAGDFWTINSSSMKFATFDFFTTTKFDCLEQVSQTRTSPKFNMEPENDGFQKDAPFAGFDLGSMLNFRGVLPQMVI